MGCGCGSAPNGAVFVYEHHEPGGAVTTYSTEEEAAIARSRHHAGKGPIIRTTRPK